MDNLFIESTKKTPEVSFSAEGRFKLSGRSIPEDASFFYENLIAWISEYCKQPHNVTIFDIDLEYLNSGSSKALLGLLKTLVSVTESGKKLNINWYYEVGDNDIMERGEYFESILKLKFNLIETI